MILPLALAMQLAALPPFAAEPRTPPAVADLLAQHDPTWDRDLPRILRGETGDQDDVPNWRFDLRHTASGYIQITNTNWLRYAPWLGIDTRRYPTAMSAPAAYQIAVGKLMHRMFGIAPWDRAHGGSQPVAGRYGQRIIAAGRQFPPLSVRRAVRKPDLPTPSVRAFTAANQTYSVRAFSSPQSHGGD